MIEAVTNEAVYFWVVRESAEKPVVGRIYITYHPSIPYEAFDCRRNQSKRVYSPEEGEMYILNSKITSPNAHEV